MMKNEDGLTMNPCGYNDETRFFETVWRFSVFPIESWDETMRRLRRAISSDAKELCVKAEMTPQRVVYAYRHHPSLGQVHSVVVSEYIAKRHADAVEMCNSKIATVDDVLELYRDEWKDRHIESYWTDERIGREMKYEAMEAVRDGMIKTVSDNEDRFRSNVSWLNRLENTGEHDKSWISVEQKITIAFFRSCRKILKHQKELNKND